MELKRYYVTGWVEAVKNGKGLATGMNRTSKGSFNRTLYAENAEDAKDKVVDSVVAKWSKGTTYYDVVECKVLSVEVFESVLLNTVGIEFAAGEVNAEINNVEGYTNEDILRSDA